MVGSKKAYELAHWFATQVQGRKAFDPRSIEGRVLLKQAHRLLSVGKDGMGLDAEDVKRAVRMAVETIRKRKPDWQPGGLFVIMSTDQSGRSFYELATQIPPPPPVYEVIAFQEWLKEYGSRYIARMMRQEG